MHALPEHVTVYKRTRVFDRTTTPAGFLAEALPEVYAEVIAPCVGHPLRASGTVWLNDTRR